MYSVDPNVFMNGVVVAVLAAFGLLLAVSLVATGVRGRAAPRTWWMNYLYMFTALTGAFSLAVAVLGFRGLKSGERPWHVFLDMKYQPKYTAQGESRFFADGRSQRLPVDGTVPFDGADYAADAGRHAGPSPDFLQADRRYYHGVANADVKDAEGNPGPGKWDGREYAEGYFVARIPKEAVTRAGGWVELLKRGQYAYSVHCAVCHGASGRGGAGPDAYGVTGAYGMANIANYHQDRLREMPDGELFNTITHGKNTMAAYGHQVPVQDRWAIVAYVRALQHAHTPAR